MKINLTKLLEIPCRVKQSVQENNTATPLRIKREDTSPYQAYSFELLEDQEDG